MKVQVQKEHYDFEEYVDCRRWISYYYQIKEARESGCETVLLIGIGDGIVPLIISNMGLHIETFDFDADLSPTYCGDLRSIEKIVRKKYDCLICCQVLEHLEFECFEKILLQFKNICTKKMILSFPVCKTEFSAYFDFPKCHSIAINFVIQKFWKKNYIFTGEHYWEVGISGKQKKDIKKLVGKYFNIEKDFYVPGYTHHWFLIVSANS